MKLQFFTIPRSENIQVSYDNLKTWYTYKLEDILSEDRKLKIDRSKCSDLNSVYIKFENNTIIKPDISDTSWQYYFNLETTDTVYKNLDELKEYLRSLPENTLDSPVELHIYNLKKNLEDVAAIIKDCQRYVNISFTILKHDDIYNDFTKDWDNLENYIDDGKEIHAFPSYFKENPYLVGITIPKQDNYSQPNVLTGCTNLQQIHFENNKKWKAENGLDYYEIGSSSVKGTTPTNSFGFIKKLVESEDTTNSFLMESEGLW